MKKAFFIILILILFSFPLFSKSFLVITTEYMEDFRIKSYYYDFTDIDPSFLMNLSCKNFVIPADYKIQDIITYLLNRVIFLKSYSELKNFSIKYKTYIKRKIVIDSNYKILEKDNKKYYIFYACFPLKKKKNFLIELLKDLFNG